MDESKVDPPSLHFGATSGRNLKSRPASGKPFRFELTSSVPQCGTTEDGSDLEFLSGFGVSGLTGGSLLGAPASRRLSEPPYVVSYDDFEGIGFSIYDLRLAISDL
jgi:hypothetical protein